MVILFGCIYCGSTWLDWSLFRVWTCTTCGRTYTEAEWRAHRREPYRASEPPEWWPQEKQLREGA
jgi:ribosomal protein L37AE/L43A